ncbi:methyl-accepting chemotaxis protein [Ureibacillus endophyticus]|uniref:Methyl-accepting chemotaxis protein n=1 Tax=Ureibacillus endophyticus TaxID=1978490 RepID=A0A494YVA3_9BACL|nr:methyl-accepting chemotaxis protein [Lysinibacillus endophyticus]RKQ14092.1 methyl-accepting chemotaxis protein [Lysinibacillus endophyticus]
MKIKKLLKISLILTLVLIAFTVWSSIYFLDKTNEQKDMLILDKELAMLAVQLQDASDYLSTEIKSYAQFGDKVHIDNYLKEVNEEKTMEKTLAQLQENKIPDTLIDLAEKFVKSTNELSVVQEVAILAVENGEASKARNLLYGSKYKAGEKEITKTLNDFKSELSKWVQSEVDAKDKALNVSKVVLFTSIILLMVSSFFSLLLVRLKLRPLDKLTSSAALIAEGDLRTEEVNVKVKDEIGILSEAFNQMTRNLKDILQQVNHYSEQVASSAEELMASAEQTSTATNQVVISIQDVTKNVEVQDQNTADSARAIAEITQGVQSIADSSSQVADSVQETTHQANLGNTNIQKVIEQMNSIYKASGETKLVMNELESKSNEIGNIIEIITSIAEQTNLLALNAAIESARAGEHGKGFAVVADEVRKLAEQSRESANQISDIIQMMQADTVKAAEMTTKGNEEINNGLKLTEQTSDTFKQILESISHVNSQTQELSSISEEISASAQQVNAAIDEVSALAKTTASSANDIASASEEQLATLEEVTASSTSLANMAEKLNEIVRRFKL